METNGKFKLLDYDPTIEREKYLASLLCHFQKSCAFDMQTYKKIYPCGSKTGVLYGLPKIHIKENQLRPIISAIGTYTHHLAKYLVEVLSLEFNDQTFMLRDTFDFVNRVSELVLTNNDYLMSFNIESLFTNIPND